MEVMGTPFKKIDDLFKAIATWLEQEIVRVRLGSNDANGRPWFLKNIGYKDTLKLEDLRKATDRKPLNDKYKQRFLEKDVKSRKGISALKIEISGLYSFNKSFVQRYKGRMHFYRDDLAQKNKRNMCAVANSMGVFVAFRQEQDK